MTVIIPLEIVTSPPDFTNPRLVPAPPYVVSCAGMPRAVISAFDTEFVPLI